MITLTTTTRTIGRRRRIEQMTTTTTTTRGIRKELVTVGKLAPSLKTTTTQLYTCLPACLPAQPKYLNKKRTRKRKVVFFFFFSSSSFPCAFIHLRYTLTSSSSSSLTTRKTVHWKNKARLLQQLSLLHPSKRPRGAFFSSSSLLEDGPIAYPILLPFFEPSFSSEL